MFPKSGDPQLLRLKATQTALHTCGIKIKQLPQAAPLECSWNSQTEQLPKGWAVQALEGRGGVPGAGQAPRRRVGGPPSAPMRALCRPSLQGHQGRAGAEQERWNCRFPGPMGWVSSS